MVGDDGGARTMMGNGAFSGSPGVAGRLSDACDTELESESSNESL